MEQVTSIARLKELVGRGQCEYFLSLNGGARSSKFIRYEHDTGKFWVLNYIDDSEEVLTENQLIENSIIGEAMRLGALYQVD